MNYYRYRPAPNDYAGIYVADEDDQMVVRLHYTDDPVAESWVPPRVYEYEDNPPKQGDFPSLSNFFIIPVMSQRAWDTLRPLIGDCCEALPVIHPSGKPYYIIHVMETIDALDEERSELERYPDGRVAVVDRYALKYDLLEGKHIFKFPRKSGAELLLDDEFRRVVEENKLKGLRFNPIPLVD